MPLTRPIPQRVSDCSRSALEWDRFLDLLGGYAQSAVGNAWLLELGPSTDAAWIDREHSLVDETRLLLGGGEGGGRPAALPRLQLLFDPSDLLAKARIEGVALEAEEIRSVADLAEGIAAWAALLLTPGGGLEDRLPRLRELFGEVLSLPLKPLVDSLRGRFLPDGTLADDASPELRGIRREMEQQHRAIEHSLRTALRRYSEGGSGSGWAQDELITIRGERFVIPVKAEWKRRVQGVVHGASSSGQTVFVEPLETIELNNDLVRLLEDEQAEIHRIFAAMTRQIAQHAGVILKGAEVLCEVDTLLARARFASEFRCVLPRFAAADGAGANFEGGTASVAGKAVARRFRSSHPCRAKGARQGWGTQQMQERVQSSRMEIVPIGLSLTGEVRQLVISGPNTGGKSVSLKTVGVAGDTCAERGSGAGGGGGVSAVRRVSGRYWGRAVD